MVVTTISNEIKFKDLGGRTIVDYTNNRVGKITFPILQNVFQSNEWRQFVFSKIIKASGIKIEEYVAEHLIVYIQDMIEKAVNLKQIEVKCPVELRVYDSQDEVTGLLNGTVFHGISRSVYYNGTVTILFPSDSYRYEVAGTQEGAYMLIITSIEKGKTNAFTATDIPISSNATHQYSVDWGTLTLGKQGVTLQIDVNNDGKFEQNIIADSSLTHDKFIRQITTNTSTITTSSTTTTSSTSNIGTNTSAEPRRIANYVLPAVIAVVIIALVAIVALTIRRR